MIPDLLCLADAELVSIEDVLPKTWWDSGFLIVVGSLLAVTLAVFIWAAFIRKPGSPSRSHSHKHSHWHPPASAPEAKPERSRSGWFFSRKRHRKRRQERPRNPTLAEAGGLPPIRTGEPPRSPI